jgi:hypothetical protein
MLRTFIVTLAVLALGSAALAQHSDIYPFNDTGQVGVAQYSYEQSAILPSRVFGGRFDSFYSVNNPGFTALSTGATLPGGKALSWDFLPITALGYTSTLLYWDGQGETANFGATPTPDYSLSLYGGNGSAAADGGDTLVPGASIGTTSASGAIHQHRYFFLDDNGDGQNTTLPLSGYYVIAMQLRIAGLETSDPFFLVWGTPDSDALKQAQVAIPWVSNRVDSLVGGGLEGDFNDDGVVNAADYTVYRDNQRNLFTAGAFPQWNENYGAVATAPATISVPEPSALMLAAMFVGVIRRR